MSLPKVFFASYLKELMEKNIRIRMMGEIERIPENARRIFLDAIEKTKNNTGMTLNFALNYGSRREIVLAARKYAEDVQKLNQTSSLNLWLMNLNQWLLTLLNMQI